jgi:phage N-6-adenine-methyltransferase
MTTIQQNASLFTSKSKEWYTPPAIVDAVIDVMGSIDLDPCADPGCNIPAKRHYTATTDGLSQTWPGRVYMNPPYGREIQKWIIKLVSEYDAGNVTQAVVLVPARVDTKWFRGLERFPVCFIDGRLKFSDHTNSAPFPSAVICIGSALERFAAVFGQLGRIYVPFALE